MKSKPLLTTCLLISALSFAQEKKAEKLKFNQELATSLGADKYGMKPYTIVMLTTGSVKIEDKAKMGELMKGHMTNIGKLADEGKIIVAGPFLEKNKENYRGMFIFDHFWYQYVPDYFEEKSETPLCSNMVLHWYLDCSSNASHLQQPRSAFIFHRLEILFSVCRGKRCNSTVVVRTQCGSIRIDNSGTWFNVLLPSEGCRQTGILL